MRGVGGCQMTQVSQGRPVSRGRDPVGRDPVRRAKCGINYPERPRGQKICPFPKWASLRDTLSEAASRLLAPLSPQSSHLVPGILA